AYADRFVKQSLLAVCKAIAEVEYLLANPHQLQNPKIVRGVYRAVAARQPKLLYDLKMGFNQEFLSTSLDRLRRIAQLGEVAQPKLNQPSFFQRIAGES